MAAWPVSLPRFHVPGFSYQPRGNVVAIDPEVGEPMTRRRYTGSLIDVSGSLVLTTAQLTVFRDFWRDDLDQGAQRFTTTDPIFGTAVEMVFLAPYDVQALGGDAFAVSLSLRQIG